jgi:hypothetical protein
MSIISRLTTWTIGQVLKAADLNAEFSNITNLLNNLDADTTRWTNVDSGTFKRNGTTILTLMQRIQLSTATTGTGFTSSSYQSTALSQAITPTSTSSIIKITYTGTVELSSSNVQMFTSIFRGSTDLGDAGGTGFNIHLAQAAGTWRLPGGITYYDSPATTSSTTYTIKIKNADGAMTYRLPPASTTASLILEEYL